MTTNKDTLDRIEGLATTLRDRIGSVEWLEAAKTLETLISFQLFIEDGAVYELRRELADYKAMWREITMHHNSASTVATENAKLRREVERLRSAANKVIVQITPEHELGRSGGALLNALAELKEALSHQESEEG